jgi:UDP-glucuronate 4-epimerase
MRYVVTGAAGFIGSHVCTDLLHDGHDVVGVDSFTDYYDVALKRRNTSLLLGHESFVGVDDDLLTTDLAALLAGADAVIHLAGQPGVRLSWADHFHLYVERNITASQRLLEAARHSAVPRVVLASSSSVYGNAPSYPTTEESPTRPFSPYGVTKLAMEQLAWSYAENWGVPVVALRYFTVYGPRQRPDMGMHRFIAKAAASESITVYGDGEQVRDFTFVSDVAAATIAAASADLPTPTVLNVAGGSSGTVNDVLQLVAEHVGQPVRTRYSAPQPGDVRVTGGAIDRARGLLHWEPAVPLDEGIKRQVAHQLGPDNGWA